MESDHLRARLAALAALVVVSVAGCGSDDSDGAPAPKPEPEPRVSEFRVAAEELCATATTTLLAETEFGGLAKTQRFARVAGRLVRTLRTDVALIPVPDRFREPRARYTTSLDVSARNLEPVEAAAAERDAAAVADALAELGEKPGEAAREIKLAACAGFANTVARTP